jgi:uncharacterized protein YchJ
MLSYFCRCGIVHLLQEIAPALIHHFLKSKCVQPQFKEIFNSSFISKTKNCFAHSMNYLAVIVKSTSLTVTTWLPSCKRSLRSSGITLWKREKNDFTTVTVNEDEHYLFSMKTAMSCMNVHAYTVHIDCERSLTMGSNFKDYAYFSFSFIFMVFKHILFLFI